MPGSFEHEEDDELSEKARTFLMPASKRQQRERRTACPAGNELIERQRLDLSHHGGARIRSFGERGSRQGSTCSSAWQMEATGAVGLRLITLMD